MIEYTYGGLFKDDSISKQVTIEFDNTVITNEDLFDQEITLTERLCSEEQLTFGCCEASTLTFKVANIAAPMINKWITVKMSVEGHTEEPFMIGRYKVVSDKPTADRQWREITAYDAMYDILNSDAAAWYNTILPNGDSTVTLKEFRTSFISYFGLEQEEIELVNDDMVVEKTIDITASEESSTEDGITDVMGEALRGLDVITSICEINGCFGHIGRNGQFQWIYLKQDIEGLYPGNNLYPADNLFPREPGSTRIGADGTYISCTYEDFTTGSITKLQIRQEENDIGATSPGGEITDTDNCYIIEDNFLVYGKGTEELEQIAENIMTKIKKVVYRPFEADCKGNLCLEVGDAVRLVTKYEIIETYILQRTLKGIQALRDAFSAEGVETYSEQVNSVKNSIIQLKGRANILTRTIEETRQEIYDIEAGMSFSIAATAKGLETEIERATNAENALQEDYNAKLELTAEQLTSEFTAELQTWDTGSYDISFRGDGEPEITVAAGKYYLDEESGAIYIGVDGVDGVYEEGGWTDAASYEYVSDEACFKLGTILDSGFEDIIPRTIRKSALNNYEYISSAGPDNDGDYGDGDVWLEITDYRAGSAIADYAMLDYWIYSLGNYTAPIPPKWEIADYAAVMDLDTMASKIIQAADKIKLQVSRGEVTTQLLLEPDDIYLKTGRLRIETDNLEINKDGSSGEILSRNLSESGVTAETARYIRLNTGGIEGGYGSDVKCKIVCNDTGLEFRGKILTFCMNSIKVGEGMNSTSLKTAYTGDIKYAVQQTDGTIGNATLSVRNGMIMKNE